MLRAAANHRRRCNAVGLTVEHCVAIAGLFAIGVELADVSLLNRASLPAFES